MKKALITGITGQDGSYLAELLLQKNYEVFGTVRRASRPNLDNIAHIEKDIKFISADLTDSGSLTNALEVSGAQEVYNLAAQSHVGTSFNTPVLTADITGVGTLRILEAIRTVHGTDLKNADIKFYQASSSEMYGKVQEPAQNETTPFYPRSPYGCAKLFSHWITKNYRESYGLFACSGILFNHESPRRGEEFVTRKVTKAVAEILRKRRDKLHLGNLSAHRDWGHAVDYVSGMWKMLQHERPDDYVLATGCTYSVEYLLDVAFSSVDLNWRDYVVVDETLKRPSEVDVLLGDASKALNVLGWEPLISFEEMIHEMVDSDIRKIDRGI
jgi:GDPmannose 4,6-dehydratase